MTETDNLCARILDSGSLTTFQTDRAALAADVRAALAAKDAEIKRLRHQLVSARAYLTDEDRKPCGVAVGDAEDIAAAIDAVLRSAT